MRAPESKTQNKRKTEHPLTCTVQSRGQNEKKLNTNFSEPTRELRELDFPFEGIHTKRFESARNDTNEHAVILGALPGLTLRALPACHIIKYWRWWYTAANKWLRKTRAKRIKREHPSKGKNVIQQRNFEIVTSKSEGRRESIYTIKESDARGSFRVVKRIVEGTTDMHKRFRLRKQQQWSKM